MARLKTLVPDVLESKSIFALMLSDRFTETNQLAGRITVRIANQPFVKPFIPQQQAGEGTFFFFDLPPASYTLQVRSNEAGRIDDSTQVNEPPYYLSDPAYYLDANVPIRIPPAHDRWPAFPDLLAADQDKPLDDPLQPQAFREQRALVTLQPSTAYPFPVGATLVRGRVLLSSGAPVANARVRRVNDDLEYLTGPDGQFVLFFKKVVGASEGITLNATRGAQIKQQPVTIRRGMTVSQDIVM